MWLHNLIPQSPIATHRQCDNWFIFVGLFQLPACGIFCFINFYFCPWAFLRGFKSFLWYRAYATWWFLLYDFFFVHLQFTRSCHGWMITENSKKRVLSWYDWRGPAIAISQPFIADIPLVWFWSFFNTIKTKKKNFCRH